jgi:hypothetical protein
MVGKRLTKDIMLWAREEATNAFLLVLGTGLLKWLFFYRDFYESTRQRRLILSNITGVRRDPNAAGTPNIKSPL